MGRTHGAKIIGPRDRGWEYSLFENRQCQGLLPIFLLQQIRIFKGYLDVDAFKETVP